MSYGTNTGQDFTLVAAADLSAKQYFGIIVDSTGKAALGAGAAGEAFVGVLQNDPTSGQAAAIRTLGPTPVQCGGVFAAGDLLSLDSAGKFVKYTKATVFTGTPYTVSGSMVVGRALTAGATGATATALINPSGYSS